MRIWKSWKLRKAIGGWALLCNKSACVGVNNYFSAGSTIINTIIRHYRTKRDDAAPIVPILSKAYSSISRGLLVLLLEVHYLCLPITRSSYLASDVSEREPCLRGCYQSRAHSEASTPLCHNGTGLIYSLLTSALTLASQLGRWSVLSCGLPQIQSRPFGSYTIYVYGSGR